MANFVIVHGAFGGGWEWTPVAELLRGIGHRVFTPTLTGMGERHHLGPAVGMTTHIDDLVAVVEYEELQGLVICGASYGGMAVTAAADRLPGRISLVIYIDALIPRDGQSGLDLLPDAFAAQVRAAVDESGHGWVSIPRGILPPAGLISEQIRQSYIDRLRPQPAASFIEPVHLSGSVEQLPRAFIRCTSGGLNVGSDPIAPMAARARSEGWPYREINAPHDPHLFDAPGVAALLHELASQYQR